VGDTTCERGANTVGVGGRAPSGVQGQSPWSGGQEGEATPDAERKLNFDDTIINLFNSSLEQAFLSELKSV